MDKDYIIFEHWKDGDITAYICRQPSVREALDWAQERYDIFAHIWNQHGTTLTDRPERFVCVGHNKPEDTKRYWHPAIAMSSLVETVYTLDELEK
jgi:hypothetical protein